MHRLGFIGCGNLAQALIVGAIERKVLRSNQILATDKVFRKLHSFQKKTKIRIATNHEEVISFADIIFLAVKPQDLLPLLRDISPKINRHQIIVSLAAGMPGDVLKKELNRARSILRVMGNTAATVQQGLFGIYFVKGKRSDLRKVEAFFRMSWCDHKCEFGPTNQRHYCWCRNRGGFCILFYGNFCGMVSIPRVFSFGSQKDYSRNFLWSIKTLASTFKSGYPRIAHSGREQERNNRGWA